jgi:hypothetical protein
MEVQSSGEFIAIHRTELLAIARRQKGYKGQRRLTDAVNDFRELEGRTKRHRRMGFCKVDEQLNAFPL